MRSSAAGAAGVRLKAIAPETPGTEERMQGMADTASELAEVIKEIEEVDSCIADLESDMRKDPKSNAARHNKFACKALRRYRVKLTEDRDQLLGDLGG